jgi:Tfp pilus assembly major pilin PilA
MYIPSTQHQRGMTMISLLFVLGIIAFVVLTILKVVPLYIEHEKVTTILNNLKSEEGIEVKIEPEVRALVRKRLSMEDVVNATMDDVSITKNGGKLTIEIEYQAVAPLVSNISLMLDFSDSVEIGHE